MYKEYSLLGMPATRIFHFEKTGFEIEITLNFLNSAFWVYLIKEKASTYYLWVVWFIQS